MSKTWNEQVAARWIADSNRPLSGSIGLLGWHYDGERLTLWTSGFRVSMRLT